MVMTSFVEQCTWITHVRGVEIERQQKVAELRPYDPGSARTHKTVAGRRLDTTAETIASLRGEIDSLDEAAADARCHIVLPLHAVA
jgi:hypothetical protein